MHIGNRINTHTHTGHPPQTTPPPPHQFACQLALLRHNLSLGWQFPLPTAFTHCRFLRIKQLNTYTAGWLAGTSTARIWRRRWPGRVRQASTRRRTRASVSGVRVRPDHRRVSVCRCHPSYWQSAEGWTRSSQSGAHH